MDTINFDARQSIAAFELLGEVTFPTGFMFADTEVGGLSGLTYDPENNVFYALSDDGSLINPARFYTLGIDLSDGSLDAGDVTFTAVTPLTDFAGQPFAPATLDPEGIALTPEGTLLISSEGNANTLIDPFVNEFALTGAALRAFPIPARYLPTADQSSGIRNNLAFESLTITPDGRYGYTAVENALFQDGPAASLETGSLVRILKYELATQAIVGEFVYEVEPVPEAPNPAGSFSTNGLVELLAIDNNGTLLALERGFSVGQGNTVKLYEVQTQGALDVNGLNDLFRETPIEEEGEIFPPGPFDIDPAVSKRLILDVETDLGIAPDNLEALSFGPLLPNGRPSLIIASDNNFNPNGQLTQLIALGLEVTSIPVVAPVVETPLTFDDDRFLSIEPLDILLVNDDGFAADGIEILFEALTAAGHNVTFVAPLEQQSGQGTLINVDSLFQPTEIVEFAPGQFAVDGSPVVTTLAALDFILAGNEPDLVISGINEGENVGASIAISSGTVSAAATAIQRGIPAIAVSAGTLRDAAFNIDEVALEAAYQFGAEFIVDLIDDLTNTQAPNAELLPDGVGLSVNIPAVVDQIQGTAITALDETGTINFFVGDLGFGPSLLVEAAAPLTPADITIPTSEGQNFLADFVTITPIDGDWTADTNTRQTLSDRFEAAPEDAVATPLNILLTNDDGFDAEGIQVLLAALTAAGHTVTLVGPQEQQSGSGTALDVDQIFQPLEINAVGDNQFAVNAGVRTTTWAGLDFVLNGVAPDLVISGINEGENIGPGGAVSSGTVSAAVTALLRGVPAIAVSAGIDLTDPTGAATSAAFEIGAEFVVDLIARLQATQGEDAALLPDETGLSINIPVRFPEGVTEIQGVAFTESDDITPFVIDFGPLPSGGAGLRFAPFTLPADAEVDPLSEGGQFLSGFITVTALDGDWTAPLLEQEAVEARLTAPEPVLLGDSDDPAIWVNPTNPADSLVIGTLRDGGLVTFDLAGNIVQTILDADFGDIRYNNVDLVYGFELGGELVDLAVVSDRENDTLALFQIDPDTRQLTNVTAPTILETIFGVDDGEATALGLATYTSPVSGETFAFVTQREGSQVAQLQLLDNGDGTVNAEIVRTLQLPVPTGDPEDSQAEGLVVDQELGFLYVGIESEVGIVRYSAEVAGGDDFRVIRPLESPELTPDIEGLTIYYGPDGTGYLIASSQGDSSFAVYTREGANQFLGSFAVGENGPIDQTNETDGADIINVALGEAFPFGLLVVHDGANDPQNVVEDDTEVENNSTNFKFVPYEAVANAFPIPLTIDTESYDPRSPVPQSLVNGIASGDTTQTSTVLWARSTFPGEVTFEYSTSADFATLAGTATATVTDILQPVKVEIEGLDPGTDYFYRVTDAAGDSEVGTFQTSASLGERAGLRFGVSGDWRGELAPYPAIANADEAGLEFFVALGDTYYADFDSPALPLPQAETLEDFRIKNDEVYAERLGLNTFADLRASTSILATIDDHEVTNDFAGGATIGSDDEGPGGSNRFLNAFPTDDPNALQNDSTLYENGLQAFQEFNPLRDEFYGDTGDERTAFERELYRFNTYGSDAATFVLDNRSFRDEALDDPDGAALAIDLATGTDPTTAFTNFVLNEVLPFEAAAFDDSRTLLGDAQLNDLLNDLLIAEESGVTWKFIVVPEPFQALGPLLGPADRFDGYLAERTQIVEFIEDHDIDNVVFIAADIHGTLVNNITYQEAPGGPQLPTGIFEVTTGSVAFDAPFGQSVVGGAAAGGFLTPEQFAFYNSLPAIADAGTFSQDDFLENLLNTIALTPFGLDPVGLDNNLAVADGLINAELLQGRYVASHTYGWTQFDIDEATQALTVTTYGIEFYPEADILSGDPEIIADILGREPVIVSQFVVTPQGFITGTDGNDLLVGTSADESLLGLAGNDTLDGAGGNDLLDGGSDQDTAQFNSAPAGVTANLSTGAATTTFVDDGGLEFIGEITLPTGFSFGGTEVGGLSGIEFNPANGTFLAIADDQDFTEQRYYTADLDFEVDGSGNASFNGVDFLSVSSILDFEGFFDVGPSTVDPESIRIGPSSVTPGELSLYWSSEGNTTEGGAFAGVAPFIREMTFAGTQIREFTLPEGFAPIADQSSGIRDNLAFESLTLSPDQTTLFAATENALFQDGEAASLDAGSPTRIVRYDVATGEPMGQFTYVTEPIPNEPIPADAFATNGLVELLALSETQFIAVERAFSVGVGNTIQLFLADISEATDITGPEGIGEEVVPATKSLLFNLDELGIPLDNIEGITFGPTLEDGRQTLILVSDNNFSPTQFTQFLAFALDGDLSLITETDTLVEIENLTGSAFDDTLIGDPQANRLSGGAGNDTVDGGSGEDVLLGDAGDDVLAGGAGNDDLSGGSGNDSLTGNSGDDTLSGNAGDDLINGSQGNDLIRGAIGNDTLLGGGGDDDIAGALGDDLIEGNGGADILRGNAGNDTILGGAGDDDITGGLDDDLIAGNGGADTLRGGGGNDTLEGGAGSDQLSGDAGDDLLHGGAGVDVLYGGGGADILTGGAEGDRFVLGAGQGPDTITDYSLAQGDVLGVVGGISVEFSQLGGNTLVTLSGTSQILALLTGFNDTPVVEPVV